MAEPSAKRSRQPRLPTSSAVRGFLKKFSLPGSGTDPLVFFSSHHDELRQVLLEELQSHPFKVVLVLRVEMTRESATGSTSAFPFFRSRPARILSEGDIDSAVKTMVARITGLIDKWVQNGSDWTVSRVRQLDVSTAKYTPLRGGAADIPPKLEKKKAIINVKNNDDRCLMWALLSAMHPIDNNPQRVSRYTQYVDELRFDGVMFPATLSDVPKVELQNGLAINVFGYEGNLYPLYLSERQETPINLLLHDNHFTWIKNFSRACENKNKRATHYCFRCLSAHKTADSLQHHSERCQVMKPVPVVMPTAKDSILKYTNLKHRMVAPYIIYADTEAIIEPMEEQHGSSTVRTARHVPCSIRYAAIRSNGEVRGEFDDCSENAIHNFFDSLKELEGSIQEDLADIRPIRMTAELELEFQNAVNCWICDEVLGEDRVRDHDHLTGNYRGAAHYQCNIQLSIYPDRQIIPVVFHNLKGYDAHHLIAHIGMTEVEEVEYEDSNQRKRIKKVGEISVIANNMEKYISFKWRQYRFIDSMAFLNSSLDSLVSNTPEDAFKLTRTLAHHDLLLRKGVYPYEYMDSFARFDETQLPPKSAFESSLTGEGISDADYAHAQNVWQTFECSTMEAYHDLYLQTDVYLLADVFEHFRKTAYKTYGLDPAHYLTLPGYAWDALLRFTQIELQLLTDVDMHLFVEAGLRGGISMASQRYGKANNPTMDQYNPAEPTSYLLYLDANNLYGWAMCQSMPTSEFAWCDKNLSEILAHPVDSSTGFIVECDLEAPSSLHYYFNDYPLAPEVMRTFSDKLSPYQQALVEELKVSAVDGVKLTPSLLPKSKYVLHYRTLQLYSRLGMVVTAVHKVLGFQQSAWMAPYINLNTALRTRATTDFEKSFYKLMNNSVFGKTMENVRNRARIDLLREESEEQVLRAVSKPTYVRHDIFPNGLVGIEKQYTEIKLNKPVYVGMSILDLSKVHMYSFYYDVLKEQYGSRIRLLYTDTDSVIVHITTGDVYAEMDLSLYDTSNFPTDHPQYTSANKKVVGKFKDELGGKSMVEFVGLRSKMYSYIGQESAKRAKGVRKAVLANTITHKDYVDALLSHRVSSRPMTGLRSHCHTVYEEVTTKVALSPFDCKRYILDDGMATLAYGHKDI
ncbi:uncharacterized protein LOC135810966 [Sycon ciliatum]|uniref:uncharacterized protein LOC135810966 n=1 Tax=Sycon ciliatum TaxID=27933 RepID=UPI0031F68F59